MSKIIKEFWNIDGIDLNLTPYKLGQEINIESELNLFNLKKTQNKNEYEYIGTDKYLWRLIIKKNRVYQIYYRNNFPFPNFDFWNKNQNEITKELNNMFKQVDDTYKGKKLYVVYRDFFVAIIGILDDIGNGIN